VIQNECAQPIDPFIAMRVHDVSRIDEAGVRLPGCGPQYDA